MAEDPPEATGFATYPSLRDRAVFISGGASGIGAALVEHFAAQGARVAFADIDAPAARALTDHVAATGDTRPHFEHCDLRDVAAYQAAIHRAADALGPFHVLINNAAHDERHAWKDVTQTYWDDRLAVNLRHQFFAIQAVAPAMQQARAGSIINLGSISWRLAQGGMPGYTSSKAAIEGLTRSFARDLGPDNIRVNCILPGWIMTERQMKLWLTPEAEAEVLAGQCLKQKLYPPDVARMALYLAADDSRMCTNQVWTVDGGWT